MSLTEERITLALQAYRTGQSKSPTMAAKQFKVSKSTLVGRDHGIPYRTNSAPHDRKLSVTEETTLVEWILERDTRGLPVTKAIVQQKAK